jgi:predicted acetyltransferase
MDVELTPIAYEHKSVLRHLMELCLHDYSEFDGADVDEHGLFGYSRIDHYWTEPGRHAFLIKLDGNTAGFALVRDSSNTGDAHSVAEFFVLRKYRRKGVGRRAAQGVFDMFPGIWRVHQDKNNVSAQTFWRAVIGEYTAGSFREVSMDGVEGPAQEFQSAGACNE